MAFSGGTFSRTFDCTTDRDNGVKILASKFDTELDGMATGLSTCILKDGTQTCTAAIPFAQGITLPDNKTIILGTNSDVTIQYDETTNDSLEIAANVEGAALGIVLKADQGDDAGDEWKLNIADGGTLTLGNDIASAGSYVTHLTITPNSTVASSTTAVAGNLTVGGDLTLGSGAVITEAELEMLDGITAGTVSASKAMVVDANKDITGGRNLTISGELDAATLDVSGDVDIDGTLETDALSIASTAVTATGAELNYSDTGAAVGTVVASKVVTADANKDVASFRNITLTGELDAGSLDVSGDADIDGTLEADAMTLNGTAITATATLDTGISNNNVPKFTSGVADDDFLRVAGTAIEGRSAAEVLSDIGASAVAGSSSIVTTGALNAGSITSGFGSIDNGSSAITTTGVITGGTLEATTDTAAGDNAAIGYTAAEGLILTGQGSTSDITLKNDADATVFTVPTGTDDILFPDNAKAMFGASSDLQIYHSGNHSFIEDTGAGNLYLATNGTSVRITKGPQNAENMAAFNSDGSAILYYDNVAKIATTSTGVTVSGDLLVDGADPELIIQDTNDTGDAFIKFKNDSGTQRGFIQAAMTGDVMLFGTSTTEAFRIDSSQQLLVGKTDAGSDVAGATIRGNGQASFTKASDGPLVLNRKTNQGYIALFQYDDTSIGQIGVDANDNFYITGQAGDTGGFYFNDAALSPAYQGAERDNFYDLGKSGARFDDIFATNATIQTSDQNEKQQIASLTDAEITAAKAISALFKTFKWKDKVESKGDAARTHSGVIAQEVQTAMTNAGLDAADYAFWCSDTWWETTTNVPAVEASEEVLDKFGTVTTEAVEAKDAYTRIDTYSTADEAPDGATQRTRMGIRYPELLAFVGAATEQRLASIETRLTALEAG